MDLFDSRVSKHMSPIRISERFGISVNTFNWQVLPDELDIPHNSPTFKLLCFFCCQQYGFFTRWCQAKALVSLPYLYHGLNRIVAALAQCESFGELHILDDQSGCIPVSHFPIQSF